MISTYPERKGAAMRQSLLVALILMLTGCAGGASPTPVATASPSANTTLSASPSPTASPSPVKTPVVGDFLEQGFDWGGAAAHPGGYVAIASPWLLTSDSKATAWTPVDLEDQACPDAVAVRGSVVVAVGRVGACHAGGGSAPAAWYSPDGNDWLNGSINDPDTRGGGFSGVVAGPAGFVAWGYVGNISEFRFPIFDEPYAAAPWVSADGASWATLADQEPFALSYVTRIVSGGPGLVAVGYEPGNGDQASRAVIWTSADGQAWDRIDDGLPFDYPQTQPPIDIGGDGSHLIVWQGGGDGVTRLWSSADGVMWQPAPDLPLSAWSHVSGIGLFGDDFIAFGSREVAESGISLPCTKDQHLDQRCHLAAAIWLSGPDWELLPESAIPDSDSIVGMLARPTGLLAFGSTPQGPALWSSADGRVWSRLSLSLTRGL